MSTGIDKDKQKNFPFFWGVWYGAWNKFPSWYVGGLRSGAQFGLAGRDQLDLVNFHDNLTAVAAKAGVQALWSGHYDLPLAPLIWNATPTDAKAVASDWSKGVAAQVVGGSIISAVTGNGLLKHLHFPQPVVAPVLLYLTWHGVMGAFWKESWKKDPPPDGGGVVGGGKSIDVAS